VETLRGSRWGYPDRELSSRFLHGGGVNISKGRVGPNALLDTAAHLLHRKPTLGPDGVVHARNITFNRADNLISEVSHIDHLHRIIGGAGYRH